MLVKNNFFEEIELDLKMLSVPSSKRNKSHQYKSKNAQLINAY
jgi:hypothetical protein